MQKITLEGRLGRDASLRETKTGKKFVSITVATNLRGASGVEKTQWWDVMWFGFNEGIVPHLKKGSAVILGGDLDADLETGDDGVNRCRRTVIADYITFASSGGKQQDGTEQTAVKQTPQPPQDVEEDAPVVQKKTTKAAPVQSTDTDDSDLPF